MDQKLLSDYLHWLGRHQEEVLALRAQSASISESIKSIQEAEQCRNVDSKSFESVMKHVIQSSMSTFEESISKTTELEIEDNFDTKSEVDVGCSWRDEDEDKSSDLCSKKQDFLTITSLMECETEIGHKDTTVGLETDTPIFITIDTETDGAKCSIEDGNEVRDRNADLSLENFSTSIMGSGFYGNVVDKISNYGQKKRQKLIGIDAVMYELQEEFLMERGNQDLAEFDVLNDISETENQRLVEDVTPSGVFELVYGVDGDTSSLTDTYPIRCDTPCEFLEADGQGDHNIGNIGPFLRYRLGNSMFLDKAITMYMLDPKLNKSELLVVTDTVVVRRCHLLTLEANNLLDSRIINSIADMMRRNECEMSQNQISYWWIPTSVTRPNRFSFEVMSERSKWNDWVGPLSECKKIYLPILAKRHWFIAVVNIKEEEVHVFDSLDIPSVALGTAIIDTILKSLDSAFRDDIIQSKGEGWSFDSFAILQGHSSLRSCVDYECGIYVIKFMQAAYNKDKICSHGFATNERLCVALQLILSPYNKIRADVVNRSHAWQEIR